METERGGGEVVFGRWRRGLVVERRGETSERGGVVEETRLRLRVCRDDEEADDETAATGTTVRFEDVEAWERVKRRDSRRWTWSSMGKKTRGMRLKTRGRGDAGGEGETTTVWARERGSGGEDFCEVMEEALTRWERKKSRARAVVSEESRRRAMGASVPSAGVADVINRQVRRAEATHREMDEAFTDLRALMEKAGEMVALAERLAESTESTGEDENDAELRRLVLSLGIKSPVTRLNAGAGFHTDLGQQFGDFVKSFIGKFNGIVSMCDAFCLFNRARGTELVSPRDILCACESWSSLGIDLHVREFKSGLKVIHSRERTDENVCARLSAVLTSDESSLDSYDAAQILETTPEIALEYLCVGEARGILCRDDGPSEVRFYANKFADVRLD